MIQAKPLDRGPRFIRERIIPAIYGTKRWAIIRRHVLAEEGVCRMCGRLATQVDHIQPIEKGGNPWRRDNLQALCRSCHSRKTRAEMLEV